MIGNGTTSMVCIAIIGFYIIYLVWSIVFIRCKGNARASLKDKDNKFPHLLFVLPLSSGNWGAKILNAMNLKSLSRNEKIAILKSLLTVAGADGHLSRSESSYLGIFIMKMGEDQSFLNTLNTIPNSEVVRILNNFSYSDKQDLLYLWVEIAVKSHGNMTGVFRINDLHEAKDTIISLAKICNISLDLNKEYTFYF